MKKVKRIYVDGFLNYGGIRNGCSYALYNGNNEQNSGIRHLNHIQNRRLRKLSEENKITNFVVEWFAIYTGIVEAKKYGADFLYSDSEVIVKQMNGKYMVHNEVHRVWFNICKKMISKKLKILWISRIKMVEVLGH